MANTAQINIRFEQNEIDVQLASVLPSIGCGGECIFIGRTRPERHETHGELTALVYECYQAMAESELHALALDAIDRFNVRCINVTHSIGEVPIDQASVVIAVSSDHRDDAFLACRCMIDLLKQRVPIWKQEQWSDGTTWSNGVPLQHG